MLELINQLDGFDARGNIKVLMATNRPDTLDPALVRPGRLDRKVEFALPELDVSNNYIVVEPLNYMNLVYRVVHIFSKFTRSKCRSTVRFAMIYLLGCARIRPVPKFARYCAVHTMISYTT